MNIEINPNTWTVISNGDCRVSGGLNTELIRFRSNGLEVASSYLNSAIMLYSSNDIEARSNSRVTTINVSDLNQVIINGQPSTILESRLDSNFTADSIIATKVVTLESEIVQLKAKLPEKSNDILSFISALDTAIN